MFRFLNSRNFYLVYFTGVLAVICLVFTSLSAFSLSESEYKAQKSGVDTEIQDISNELQVISSSLHDVSSQKNSLQAEVASVQAEIEKVNGLIVRTTEVAKKLDGQIVINKEKIATLRERMKDVLREIQKNQKITPIQNIISSENFGQAIGRLYALSTAQANANDLKIEIETELNELELNLAKQEQSKIDLENSKSLLESKQGYLQNLISTYQGKEDEYSKQIATLKEQQKINEEDAAKLQAAWEQEKAKLEAERSRNNNRGNTGGGGGGVSIPPITYGCWFEDAGNPGVPAGFFGRPSNGGVNQSFSCGHDAIDFGGGLGSNLLATADGVVAAKGSFNVYGYGHWIALRHTIPNGRVIYSLYAHMQGPSPLGVGNTVSRGQSVGGMGCTGICTGVHVHFMMYNESFATTGPGCQYGSSKCYNPARFL